MSRCFGSSRNLTAKDYTINKKNMRQFCEVRNKFLSNSMQATGTNIACVNNDGLMVKFNSNETLLNLKSALTNFRTDLAYFAGYGEHFKDHDCQKRETYDNTDLSNNYTNDTPLLTYANEDNTAQDNIIDSAGTYINRYAEIEDKNVLDNIDLDADLKFINKKRQLYVSCSLREAARGSQNTSIITPDDVGDIYIAAIALLFLPPLEPTIKSIEIVFI
jgi:hypothetical protein